MTSLNPETIAAICVMAAAALFDRTAGFYLMRLVPLTPRVRRILDALPGAVLVAIIAPAAVKGDFAMLMGLATALVAALLVRSDFIAVVAAMAVTVAVRLWAPGLLPWPI